MTNDSTLNVRDLGADGTPEGDTCAVHAALRQLFDQGGGTLYFPGGTYQISTKVKIQQRPGVGLAIRGDGPNLSTITWICRDGGITINSLPEGGFDGKKGATILEGLSLLTAHANGGAGLTIRTTGDCTSPAPKKLIRDILFAGSTPACSWSWGLRVIDCTFTTVSGIDYQGKGIAVAFKGQNDPVDNYVHNLRVFGAEVGIDISGNCEGVYVSQSTLLFVERGIHWHTSGAEPLLSVSGTHISASRDCIHASNLLQPIITGNLLYQCGDDDWTGIKLSANVAMPYDLGQISHNTIQGFSNSSRTGIVVTNCSGGVIQGNVISYVDTGIWLQKGTSKLRAIDNYIQETAPSDIKDDGIGNIIRRV